MLVEQTIKENVVTREDSFVKYSYYSQPCEGRTGGDFSGVKTLADGRTLFYIGDVSGHGIKAASMAKKVENIIDYCLECNPRIKASDLAQEINRYIPLINKVYQLRLEKLRRISESKGRNHIIVDSSEEYVTAFFAIYDPKTKTVSYTDAGHSPKPLYFPDIKRPEELIRLSSEDFFMGPFKGHRYMDHTITLENVNDCMLFMLTDGITERRKHSTEEEMFGVGRVVGALKNNMHNPLDSIVSSIYSDSYSFGLPQTQFDDDVSLLALTIKQSN